MGQNHNVLLLPSPVLANIHSILAYEVPDTEGVCLLTKFQFNVGPVLQPIAGFNAGQSSTTLTQH